MKQKTRDIIAWFFMGLMVVFFIILLLSIFKVI